MENKRAEVPTTHKENTCPFCGGTDLDYDHPLIEEELIYPFNCNSCGQDGREVYSLTYSITEGRIK